jgi:hypothetical protein
VRAIASACDLLVPCPRVTRPTRTRKTTRARFRRRRARGRQGAGGQRGRAEGRAEEGDIDAANETPERRGGEGGAMRGDAARCGRGAGGAGGGAPWNAS